MQPEPTVEQQVIDRQAQKAKLLAFLKENPCTLFTQETLSEACGAHIGAIRTRLSELKRSGEPLQSEPQSHRGLDGKIHALPKLWMYQPRPSQPIGRDAGERIQRTLFT